MWPLLGQPAQALGGILRLVAQALERRRRAADRHAGQLGPDFLRDLRGGRAVRFLAEVAQLDVRHVHRRHAAIVDLGIAHADVVDDELARRRRILRARPALRFRQPRLDVLLDRAQVVALKGGTGAQDASPPRKFIIDHVRVRNAKVNYGGVATVDMPDIQLRDLGKKSNGATAAEITKEIWTELTRVAISRAPAALEGLRDKAKDAAERLRGLAK